MPISDTLYGGISKRKIYSEMLIPLVNSYIMENASVLYDVSLPKAGENADFTGTAVSKLYDQTLNQLHANQATAAQQPALSDSVKQNLRQYLVFDGSDEMTSDVDINGTNATIFVLYKLTAAPDGSSQTNGLAGNDNGGWDRSMVFVNGQFAIGGTSSNPLLLTAQSNASPETPSVWNLVSVHWDGTAANAGKVYCNGKSLGNFTPASVSGNSTTFIGRDSSFAPNYFTGDIAQVIIFRQEVPDLWTRRIHEYIRLQWGITFWDSIVIT